MQPRTIGRDSLKNHTSLIVEALAPMAVKVESVDSLFRDNDYFEGRETTTDLYLVGHSVGWCYVYIYDSMVAEVQPRKDVEDFGDDIGGYVGSQAEVEEIDLEDTPWTEQDAFPGFDDSSLTLSADSSDEEFQEIVRYLATRSHCGLFTSVFTDEGVDAYTFDSHEDGEIGFRLGALLHYRQADVLVFSEDT